MKVRLKNFWSYRDTSIEFKDGLNFIVGNNLDEASMDSNGSGKTGIIQAICWAKYGKTIEGLEGDDIVNTVAGKDCMVELEEKVGEDTYLIRRYRKYSGFGNTVKFFKNGEELIVETIPATNKLIEQTFGLDYATFLSVVVFPQGFSERFADLADADRKMILERTRRDFPFDEWYNKAKISQASIEEELEILHRAEERLEIEMLEKKEKLEELEILKAGWETQHKKDMESIGAEIFDIEKKIQETKVELKTLEEKISEIRMGEEQLGNSRKEIEIKLEGLRKKYNQMGESIINLGAEKLNIDKRLQTMDRLLKLGKCPTCEQDIQEKSFSDRRQNLQGELEKSEANYLVAGRIRNGIENKIVLLEKEVKGLVEEENKILLEKERQRSRKIAREKLQSHLDGWKQALVRAKDNLKVKEQETLKIDFIGLKEEIKKITANIDKAGEKMKGLEDESGYYKFWLNGFSNRGLKSYLLDEVCAELEVVAQKYLNQLTDGDYTLSISTQSKTKAGEIRERISVDVSYPGGMRRYKGASGGQKRRIDLALLLAMREIASKNLSSQPRILFADEVFDALDSTGVERAIDLLSNISGTIVLITHDANLVEMGGNIIKIKRKGALSEVENE